ncbi:hypothetical protein [Rodentibacter caecimuris]|uniref:hypothetical protein n=1 Tax=Rodentibacter caecimuris TaxID=1796644 RepID=UPI002248C247|nr:hypothetical protein [Rodentibacter heylii]MCX2961886.1 hypothetical protein [Rodentibacter heylii]
MTLLFRKDWYTLDETVNLLNDYFQLHPFDDTLFNHSDVIQYFNEKYLRPRVNIYAISNKYLSFRDAGFLPHEFELIDAQLPVTNNFVHEFSFSCDNYSIHKEKMEKEIDLHGRGLFDIHPNNFRIKKEKGFLIHGLYPFDAIYEEEKMPNKRAVYFHCKKPVLIPFSKVIISRKDIITTIKKIKALEQESLLQTETENLSKPDLKKDCVIEELQTKITELKNQLQAQQSAVNSQEVLSVENKARRISRPQRDIFTLLTVNNYPDCQSRNDLFNRINADLQAKGITTKDIQYSTLDNLIDEDIRIGSPKKSPFPPKQK